MGTVKRIILSSCHAKWETNAGIPEYNIAERKHFDMKFGGARKFVLSGYDGEKILVRLASDTLSSLQNDFKVKLDDIRNRIDVDVE
jgi:hypothetical protein